VYWCDWGKQPKIELANMDGQGRQELVTRGLYWPNGITLDDLNNRLYWVDAYLDVLEYYDLKLHKITTLLEDGILLHPFGLTSIDDQLYWTDWSKSVVYKADKKTASNADILVDGLRLPMDIHAYDRNKNLPGKENLSGNYHSPLVSVFLVVRFISQLTFKFVWQQQLLARVLL